MTFSAIRRIIDAVARRARVLLLTLGLLAAFLTSSAQATITSGENAEDILGEYNSAWTDTTADYTKGCINNGASPLGFNANNGLALDATNHRLFAADYNNNRVLVFTLNSSNILSSKTPANVIGQPDFVSCGTGTTASTMYGPDGLAFDATNNLLYVADIQNNRVLVFNTSTITNGMSASYEIGQPSGSTAFTTNGAATSASGLNIDWGAALALDATHNRLYVADTRNNRVMEFAVPVSANGISATYEIGQPSGSSAFTSNASATSQSGLNIPTGLAVDTTNSKVYVSDDGNNRVMVFPLPAANGENASYEIGQASGSSQFTSNTATGPPTQSSLVNPKGLAVDSTNSRLFVADYGDHRVLSFTTPISTDGKSASYVLGEPDFTWGQYNGGTTQTQIQNPNYVAYDSTNNQLYVSDPNNNRVMLFNTSATLPTASVISQSSTDACSITSAGSLYCWGQNGDGEDGVNTGGQNELPQPVGLATNWTTVSQGVEDTCGIAGGALYCWGVNNHGEAGLGNTTQYYTPQQVGSATNWTSVGIMNNNNGTGVACGVAGGALYCWGNGGGGSTTPSQVGSATNWSFVSQGQADSCAITTGGALYCWGNNTYGEDGIGASNILFATSTTYNGNFGSSASAAIAAANNDCAARATAAGLSGTFLAWIAITTGTNDPNTTFVHSYGPYVEVNGTVIATNWSALVASGTLTNSITLNESGTTVTGDAWTNVGTNGKAEHSGNSAADNCASWSNGTGSDTGYYGVLGSATAAWTYTSSATATCSTAEHLICVQQNSNSVSSVSTPTQVGTASNWTTVSQGYNDTCGIAGGQLYCWGENQYGEVGVGNTYEYDVPTAVGTSITTTGWTAVSIMNNGGGDANACAIASGALYCWGEDKYGEAGQGNTTVYTTPHQVGAATTWTAVSVGVSDVCGVNNGALYCWGYNTDGEDGLGNTTEYKTPQLVSLGGISAEDATDEIGQYTSLSSAATDAWTQSGSNNGGPNALGYALPTGLALDPVLHYLYVTDAGNNRVMVYALGTDNSISTASGGHTASYVLGQSSLRNSSVSNTGFNYANGLAVDTVNSRLFVADTNNNRVLVFPTPVTNGENASYVLGQSGLGSTGANQGTGTPSQSSMYQPNDVTYDSTNALLYVADASNNRVLVFNLSGGITNGMNASYELGQPSGGTAFMTNTAATTASGLSFPQALALDSTNNRLFVVDYGNNRVMVFPLPATGLASNGESATYELGQPSGSTAFTTGGVSGGQSGFYQPDGVSYDPNNGRLFVSDGDNCRVLGFNVGPSVIANGENATYLIGQTAGNWNGNEGFWTQSSVSLNNGSGYFCASKYDPGSGRLFVVDCSTNRVMIFEGSNMPSWPAGDP
jgi:DNA-binding beta-propeller fold protein YncE